MTEHIDGSRLKTDRRYRFEYISKFLNFTQNDIAALNALAPLIFQRIPVIVDTVYRKLFSYDITKAHFVYRNQGFENLGATIDNNTLTLDSPQMTYRKDMLSMYLKRLLTQTEWNDAFLQYVSQVGQAHASKNNASGTFVDFTHINALFGYMEHILVDTLWSTENIDNKARRDMIVAINKLFWIQNDFFSAHYDLALSDKSSPVNTTKIKPMCCFFLG